MINYFEVDKAVYNKDVFDYLEQDYELFRNGIIEGEYDEKYGPLPLNEGVYDGGVYDVFIPNEVLRDRLPFLDDEEFPESIYELHDKYGEKCEINNHQGIFIGVCVSFSDYFYIIEDEDGVKSCFSSISKIKFI